MATQAREQGGFFQDALPSPVSTTSVTPRANLPQPRSHPLRPGSMKEDSARRYVEGKLLGVSRCYTKKFQPAEPGGEVTGYFRIREACRDLSEIVDVLWLSGTPDLQIPYLLNVLLSFSSYLAAFPPDPVPTFSLLSKLDHAFASLLLGQDIESGHALPGFQGGRGGMTRTDMIRCRSLVEGMRVLIVEIMSKEVLADEVNPADTDLDEHPVTDIDVNAAYDDDENLWDEEQSHEMDVARVFERTIIQLGDSLRSSTGYDVDSS